MRPGTKPKPTPLKAFEGDIHKERWNRQEPRPRPVCPSPPRWMNRAEKREWRRVAPILWRMGVLTEVDLPALEAYCACYAKWREAREKAKVGVIETKSGYVTQNPLINVEQKYLNQMRLLLAEFGMTPSSRTRTEAQERGAGAGDSLSELVSGPRLVK